MSARPQPKGVAVAAPDMPFSAGGVSVSGKTGRAGDRVQLPLLSRKTGSAPWASSASGWICATGVAQLAASRADAIARSLMVDPSLHADRRAAFCGPDQAHNPEVSSASGFALSTQPLCGTANSPCGLHWLV